MTQTDQSSTVDTISGQSVSRAAASASNPMERTLSKEPANSTMRSVLMLATGAAIIGSMFLHLSERKHEALFVGQWAPTLLLIALWGQVVKEQR